MLSNASNCTEVTLGKDGGWTPLVPKKEPEYETTAKKEQVSVETLSDDSDDNNGNLWLVYLSGDLIFFQNNHLQSLLEIGGFY